MAHALTELSLKPAGGFVFHLEERETPASPAGQLAPGDPRTLLFHSAKVEFSGLGENPVPTQVYFEQRKECVCPWAAGASDFPGSSDPLQPSIYPRQRANSECPACGSASPRSCTRLGGTRAGKGNCASFPPDWQLGGISHQGKPANGRMLIGKKPFLHTDEDHGGIVFPHQNQQYPHPLQGQCLLTGGLFPAPWRCPRNLSDSKLSLL